MDWPSSYSGNSKCHHQTIPARVCAAYSNWGGLLWAGAQALAQLAAVLRGFADTAGMQSEIFLPVLKAVGIAAAVRIAGAICKDAGQGALAVKLELLGSIAALTACLPLFTQLLSLVGNMLE